MLNEAAITAAALAVVYLLVLVITRELGAEDLSLVRRVLGKARPAR